jgi:antitoxin (DNA-binding transcriptional repressor) of toxin-antitoxin stability system
MDAIISVQDIRTSLASIAKRAEAGETFMVIRNSKPAFMIAPVEPTTIVRETAGAYTTRADGRKSEPSASDIQASRSPLRQDSSLKGAHFVADPCSPVDERDWPKELR